MEPDAVWVSLGAADADPEKPIGLMSMASRVRKLAILHKLVRIFFSSEYGALRYGKNDLRFLGRGLPPDEWISSRVSKRKNSIAKANAEDQKETKCIMRVYGFLFPAGIQ